MVREFPDELIEAAKAGMYTRTLEDATPEGFRLALRGLGVAPGAVIVALKGYNDGMETEKYHAEALAELRKLGASVLVFDGQWLRVGCFTTVIPEFLAQDPTHRAVAIRKADGETEGFLGSWKGHEAQMGSVLVKPDAIEEAQTELSSWG